MRLYLGNCNGTIEFNVPSASLNKYYKKQTLRVSMQMHN